jgi:hypothetical protein
MCLSVLSHHQPFITLTTLSRHRRTDITPFTTDAPPRVAARSLEWGYSVLEVHNATHLYYEQRACDRHGGHHDRDDVIDSVWLVQRQHGSFAGRGLVGGWEMGESAVDRRERRRALLRRGRQHGQGA